MPACGKPVFWNTLVVLSCLVGSAQAVGHATAADAPPRIDAAVAGKVPWHRDLAQAKTASLISHRPVLIVFTSRSSEAAAMLDETALATQEAAALLTACFEPVRIDVDADETLARSLGVSRLPTACVIDADDRLLAKFDCPQTPAAFVAAAGRAAQEAASAARQPSVATAAVALVRQQSDFTKPAAEPPVAPPPPPEQLVAAAAQKAAAPAAAAAVKPATAESVEPQAAHEPTLPASPPAWPPESAGRQLSGELASSQPRAPSPVAGSGRQVLDPAPTKAGGETGGMAPWLGANASASTAAATESAKPAQKVADSVPTPETKNPVSGFFAALQKPFGGFSKPAETKPAPESATAPTGAAQATAPDPHGSMPLGLEGYCPVSLADKGTWVEGRAQWGARHRGRTYLFAGAEQQGAFLKDPDRYAPALSGDDPVLACDQGRQVAGQRRYGVTYQARTYLFSSPETRTAFAANPQRYTARVTLAEQPTAAGTVTR
jgi:YHS domain-containing protein